MLVCEGTAHVEALRRAEVTPLDDDALRQDDTRMSLGPGDGISYRLELELEHVAGAHGRGDTVEVNLVWDRMRPVHRWPRPAEHTPGTAHVTPDERRDRLALLFVRALVEEDQRPTVALVDGAGPLDDDGEVETVERDVPVASLVHVPGPPSFTVIVRRVRVEIARTAPVAVACDQYRAAQPPLLAHHTIRQVPQPS
jgi:hypothetical protein